MGRPLWSLSRSTSQPQRHRAVKYPRRHHDYFASDHKAWSDIVIEAETTAIPYQLVVVAPQSAAAPTNADEDCYLLEGSGGCFYCRGPETD